MQRGQLLVSECTSALPPCPERQARHRSAAFRLQKRATRARHQTNFIAEIAIEKVKSLSARASGRAQGVHIAVPPDYPRSFPCLPRAPAALARAPPAQGSHILAGCAA